MATKLIDTFRQYDFLLKVALADLNVLWQLSQVFLITNTLIIGFVIPKIIDNNGNLLVQSRSGYFLLSLIGLIVSILWFISYRRTSKYYNFRLSQLRRIEPRGWDIYGGEAYHFMKGKKVSINDQSHKMEKYLISTNRRTIPIIISIFILIHILVLIYTFPF